MVWMASCVGPFANQIVIDAGQLRNRWVVGRSPGKGLYGIVQFPQHGSAMIFAYQALYPEKRREPCAARYRRNLVQAGARVDDHMPGGQFDAVAAVAVLNDELSAVVLRRFAEEQGRRDIAAHALRRAGYREDGIVDMVAVGAPARVAVEARRQNAQGKRGRNESGILSQGVQYEIAHLPGQRVIQGQLLIALGLDRHMSGRKAPVGPVGLL